MGRGIGKKTIQRRAQEMLNELGWWRLEVNLGRARDPAFTGHMIRRVDNQNPRWYQKLCDQYQKRRNVYVAKCENCGLLHDRRAKLKDKRCQRSRGRKRPRVVWKSDTSIVRDDMIRGLKELISGECRTEYAKRLDDLIRREWQERKDAQRHKKIMLNYLASAGLDDEYMHF